MGAEVFGVREMFVRELKQCMEFVAGDKSILRELFNPLKDDLNLRYSLAHAVVKPGTVTALHKLKASEVYFILSGIGVMFIDGESKKVKAGSAVYIPPDAKQRIKNTGKKDLVFLCIVDPAWSPELEEILK